MAEGQGNINYGSGAPVTPPAVTNVQTFSVGGAFVWNKPAGAVWVKVQMIGGGAAGNDGVVGAAGALPGLPAGGGGAYGEFDIPASALLSAELVNVGLGGTAAAQQGGSSFFGKYAFVRGGIASGSNAQASGYPTGLPQASWGNFVYSGGLAGQHLAQNAPSAGRGGCGGGAGGDFVSSTVTNLPGNGGGNIPTVNPATGGFGETGPENGIPGGLAGTPNGQNGSTFVPGACFGGTGGGGGAANIAANGGNGGNGGFPGGGGGAGGSAFTGFTGGIHGNGADGMIIVTTFF